MTILDFNQNSSSKDIIIYQGEIIPNLTCEAEGKPRPTLRWYFDGAPIHTSNNYPASLTKMKSVIFNVSLESTGLYSCTGTNALRSLLLFSYHVRVKSEYKF